VPGVCLASAMLASRMAVRPTFLVALILSIDSRRREMP
jgi:hypothetical protein